MDVNRIKPAIIVIFMIALAVLSGCTGGGKSGETLYQEKCDKCHALRSPQTFTAEEWPLVVNRMQSHDPQWISDSEKEKIIEYMQANAKE